MTSSRASAGTAEVALAEAADVDGCVAVVGASGGDRLCATNGATVVGVRAQPRGLACPSGGRAVSWGTDANANHLLDPSELEGSTYVCTHGRGRGAGSKAVVVTTALRERDGHCPAGGTLVQSGIDRDGDGKLAVGEIDRATFACNRFGGASVLATVDVADEPPGAVCARGGKRIAVGHEGEAPRISYACDPS